MSEPCLGLAGAGSGLRGSHAEQFGKLGGECRRCRGTRVAIDDLCQNALTAAAVKCFDAIAGDVALYTDEIPLDVFGKDRFAGQPL